MTHRAAPADGDRIAEIYQQRHPDDPGRLTTGVHVETETLVARNEVGRVVGFALVAAMSCGVEPYGIIHQLEVSTEVPFEAHGDVRSALVEACVGFLADRGVDLLYARTLDKGTNWSAMLRYAKSREWVLDPATGKVDDVGPTTPRAARQAGLDPGPVHNARYVSN